MSASLRGTAVVAWGVFGLSVLAFVATGSPLAAAAVLLIANVSYQVRGNGG